MGIEGFAWPNTDTLDYSSIYLIFNGIVIIHVVIMFFLLSLLMLHWFWWIKFLIMIYSYAVTGKAEDHTNTVTTEPSGSKQKVS